MGGLLDATARDALDADTDRARAEVRRPAGSSSILALADVTLTDGESVLVSGSDDEVFDFMESDEAVVVDWRGFFDEICEDFGRHLPAGYLELEETDAVVVLRTSHAVAAVPLEGDPPFGLDVAAAIARILQPDFEAHAFEASVDSDTHCYLVRSGAWWDAFRAEHPRRFRALFCDPSALPDRFVVRPAR